MQWNYFIIGWPQVRKGIQAIVPVSIAAGDDVFAMVMMFLFDRRLPLFLSTIPSNFMTMFCFGFTVFFFNSLFFNSFFLWQPLEIKIFSSIEISV